LAVGAKPAEALPEHRRLVVLGDPGGGKTTLANWLAWRLSAGLSSPLQPFLADKVPLPCVFRELPSEVFTQETPLAGLVEHIVRRLLGDKVSDELRATLHARVAAGKYVLILDGIDEIPLAACDRVRTASVKDACVLATSRVVGYDDLPVGRMTYFDRFRELFASGQRLPPDLSPVPRLSAGRRVRRMPSLKNIPIIGSIRNRLLLPPRCGQR
jgi:predicted NACHT family NTPase